MMNYSIINKKKIIKSSFSFGGKNKFLKKKTFDISIITVVKNDEKKIQKTIKSVLKQKIKNLEYIIIEGNSSDNTLKKIKQFNNKIDLWISAKDQNLWDAINKGIALSSGKIIGVLNSGDCFYKNSLNIILYYFNNFKIDYLFGSVKKDRIYKNFYPEKIFYRFNIYPAHSGGFFIKKKCHLKIGQYNTQYISADYDFLYRLIKNKQFKGMATKKNELISKFDLDGISSKIIFFRNYYEEIKIRFKNGQNVFFLIILFSLKIINKLRNSIIK